MVQKRSAFFIALAVALLAAVAWWLAPVDEDQARWDDYLSRLERLTRQALPAPPPLDLQRYPRNRDLRLPIPVHRVDLLDYLELRHCDLMTLISKRNSALGKIQAASLRFQYEVRFIRRARQCLSANRLENPELVALLTEVVEQKSAALPALYWNALAAGEEMHHFFGQTPSARTGDSQGALRALPQLATVRDPRLLPPAQYLANMEEHLQKLAHSQAGGILLRRTALALRELQRGNALLAGIDPERLCPRGRASTRARRLRNVLDNIWGPKVQQALADSWRQRRQLADSLAAIQAMLPSPPPAFSQWQAHYFGPNGVETRMEQALQRHVELWQNRLRPCGLMPGQRR